MPALTTNPRGSVHVLQTLDESSYTGGEMGADHPITWCHPQGGGRAFYTGLGLISAATLMLQIIETRIISVTSWYHLAFFVISVAMFGLTAGAAIITPRRRKRRK